MTDFSTGTRTFDGHSFDPASVRLLRPNLSTGGDPIFPGQVGQMVGRTSTSTRGGQREINSQTHREDDGRMTNLDGLSRSPLDCRRKYFL